MAYEFPRSLEPLLALQRAMERAMSEDFFGFSTTNRGSFPPVSVFKGQDEVLLTAELPGVRKEDLTLEVKNDLLRLAGERRPDYDGNEVSVHRQERSFGRFDRSVKLPFPVDPDKVRATFENGVLSVALPLAEAAKPKKIAIG